LVLPAGQKDPAAAMQMALSAVPPVQKKPAGHFSPEGNEDRRGQKLPGGDVQCFGSAEPPSQ
jgi:hypothetical protein